MYFSTILAATAATLAAASPVKRQANGVPSFAISDFFYDSSSTGTFWFSAQGFANGSPANGFPFPGVTCPGTSDQTDYSACSGPGSGATLSAYVNGTASPAQLLVKYEVVDTDAQTKNTYLGHADVVPTVDNSTAPTAYTVIVSQQSAVA